MADRSLFAGAAHHSVGAACAGRTLVIVAASLLVNGCNSAPAPQPEATPVVTTLAPAPVPDTLAAAPPLSGAPAAAFPPAVAPAETPSPAPASAEPTPDPGEARKKQEEKLRSEVAAAKGQADTLSARAATECPDLKPGEMRHPGAVGACARLRAEAAQAVSQYETLKKQAQALGLAVQ